MPPAPDIKIRDCGCGQLCGSVVFSISLHLHLQMTSFSIFFISTGALISAVRKPGWSYITNCPESGTLISSWTPAITSLLCCLAHQTQMNQLLVISLRIPVTKIWSHLKRCHLKYKLIYRSLRLVDCTQWQRLQKGKSFARDPKRNRQRLQGKAN